MFPSLSMEYCSSGVAVTLSAAVDSRGSAVKNTVRQGAAAKNVSSGFMCSPVALV